MISRMLCPTRSIGRSVARSTDRSIDRSIERPSDRPRNERTNRRYASDARSIKRNVRAHIAKLIVSNWISYSHASAYIREHRIPYSVIRRTRAYDARCIEIIPSIKATKRDQLVNNLIDESSSASLARKNPRDRDNEIMTNRHVRQRQRRKISDNISRYRRNAMKPETENEFPRSSWNAPPGRIRALERRKIAMARFISFSSRISRERDPRGALDEALDSGASAPN